MMNFKQIVLLGIYLFSLNSNSKNLLDGTWVIDREKTLVAAEINNSPHIGAITKCLKEKDCASSLFEFNDGMVSLIYSNEYSISNDISYYKDGPYEYEIIYIDNKSFIKYTSEGIVSEVEFKYRDEWLKLKHEDFNEYYRRLSHEEVSKIKIIK